MTVLENIVFVFDSFHSENLAGNQQKSRYCFFIILAYDTVYAMGTQLVVKMTTLALRKMWAMRPCKI